MNDACSPKIRLASSHYLLWSLCALLMMQWISAPASAQVAANIKSGDSLYVEVYRAPELTGNLQVDSRGFIQMAYAGSIKVTGVIEKEAAARISKALAPYLRNPRVTVSRSQGFSGSIQVIPGRGVDMLTEIIQLRNARAEDLHASVQGMVSSGGNVGFDANTNSLLITDNPKTLSNIRKVILQLDAMKSQLVQVSIETRIAEVRVGALKEIGIRWFARDDHSSAGFTPDTVTGTLENPFVPSTDAAQIPIGLPIPGQAFFGYKNTGLDLRALLDMLVTEEDAEILANPTTMTVNHQAAHIEMTDRIPYTEFGTFVTGETSFATKFIDAGISLDVTPHVYEDTTGPYVKLELNPSVSFPSSFKNGVPVLSVRQSQTIANVRDRQTLVVGGIISETQRDMVSKVPVLGDIPIIGALFRNKSKGRERTELMIFVTPTIHAKPEDISWEKMVIGENYSIVPEPETTDTEKE